MKLKKQMKDVILLCALLLAITSCGSKQTSVKIVDSFCEGKYYPQTNLVKKDFDNFSKIRANQDFSDSLDKLLQNLTINEKEFKQCPNLAKDQPKD